MHNNNNEYLISCRCESAWMLSQLLCCLKQVASSSSSSSRGFDLTTSTSSSNGGGNSRRNNNSNSNSGSRNKIIPVTVYCTPSNITFHVSCKSKQSQASIDIQKSMFSEYNVYTNTVEEDDGEEEATTSSSSSFCVNLITLLECLHIFGTNSYSLNATKLCFNYNRVTEILKIELLETESGILSSAAIPGMILSPENDDIIMDGDSNDNAGEQNETSLAYMFRSSPIVARIIFKSNILREVIPELESVTGASSGTVSFVLVNDDNNDNSTATNNRNCSNARSSYCLQFSIVGQFDECFVSIPAHGDHVVSLEVPHTIQKKNREKNKRRNNTDIGGDDILVRRSYPLHTLLGSLLKGCLDIADETCVTINRNGMMAIQHIMTMTTATATDGGETENDDVHFNRNPNYMDFIMNCLLDEDDEDEENDGDEENEENENHVPQSLTPTLTPTLTQQSQPYIQQKHQQKVFETDDENQQACDYIDNRKKNKNKPKLHHQQQKVVEIDDGENNQVDDDDNIEEQQRKLLSVAPLFGTIVRDNESVSTSMSRKSSTRRQSLQRASSRRRRTSHIPQQNGEDNNTDGDDDDDSTNNNKNSSNRKTRGEKKDIRKHEDDNCSTASSKNLLEDDDDYDEEDTSLKENNNGEDKHKAKKKNKRINHNAINSNKKQNKRKKENRAEQNHFDDDDDDEPLDVTAVQASRSIDANDDYNLMYCSSPEIIYGKNH